MYNTKGAAHAMRSAFIMPLQNSVLILTQLGQHDNINLALRAAEADRIYRVDSSRPR